MPDTHSSPIAPSPTLYALLIALALVCMPDASVGWVQWMGEQGIGHAQGWLASAPAAPSPTTPMLRADDGFADHGLFNEAALLDTRQIDDLRADPEGQCIADQGVVTPTGACVDAIALWESEVDASAWAELEDAYPRDIDHSDGTESVLRVPAEYVILGGAGGEDVVAVDLTRPLTPRA